MAHWAINIALLTECGAMNLDLVFVNSWTQDGAIVAKAATRPRHRVLGHPIDRPPLRGHGPDRLIRLQPNATFPRNVIV